MTKRSRCNLFPSRATTATLISLSSQAGHLVGGSSRPTPTCAEIKYVSKSRRFSKISPGANERPNNRKRKRGRCGNCERSKADESNRDDRPEDAGQSFPRRNPHFALIVNSRRKLRWQVGDGRLRSEFILATCPATQSFLNLHDQPCQKSRVHFTFSFFFMPL